uniref:THAP4-like heme-binding domain-containing protein n=1 Tax=Triticum urartu TaxID=4572 RepID=A0A8R7PT04_TRIUA
MEAAGPQTQPPAPHPLVAPLSFLLGKWRGEGEGTFPSIAPFRYGEEILFSHHPSKVHRRLPAVCVPSVGRSAELFMPLPDSARVRAAGDLVHAEDVEGGVRRPDARREWVLAAPPRRLRRGGHRPEHRPHRGPDGFI